MATLNSPSSPTTTVLVPALTANIHAYGGFIIAEKLFTPYIPRFETVKVPPVISSGLSLFSLALAAMSLTSVEIYSNPLRLIELTYGARRPLGVYTANDILTFLYSLTKSPIHELFVAGTFTAARAAAFITKSFTESFTDECLFSLALNCIKLSTCTAVVT